MTDEVFDDDFDEVIENVTICSECDDYMEHEILKERKVGTGRDLLLKCKTCSAITNLQEQGKRCRCSRNIEPRPNTRTALNNKTAKTSLLPLTVVSG